MRISRNGGTRSTLLPPVLLSPCRGAATCHLPLAVEALPEGHRLGEHGPRRPGPRGATAAAERASHGGPHSRASASRPAPGCAASPCGTLTMQDERRPSGSSNTTSGRTAASEYIGVLPNRSCCGAFDSRVVHALESADLPATDLPSRCRCGQGWAPVPAQGRAARCGCGPREPQMRLEVASPDIGP
jgi:hypothetical protein